VHVDAFLMDRTPVTNRQFGRFVDATGYLTLAERAVAPGGDPGMAPGPAVPGSWVFDPDPTPSADDVADPRAPWWRFRAGAHWRQPLGPGSTWRSLPEHPVVHVAWADAAAYADWAGRSLPTEAEWECAARGGLDGAEYAWGDELAPGGTLLANYWQGGFPHENACLDGWPRTSPVGHYPANAFGLHDMIGNVWEWTDDWWGLHARPTAPCCVPQNPRGGDALHSLDPLNSARTPRKVIKGGSHLCAANYCQRYRPAARHPQAVDTPTGHIGFRCVIRVEDRRPG
jgi:formylglycine-generating enzyme required for sulfatase activity